VAKEKQLWDKIKGQLGNAWDAQRHEDEFSVGIPDVSYGAAGINGWIELKRLERYPKNPQTVIKIKHFTGVQKNWLYERQQKGGHCWLLLQIADDYYLFKGDRCDKVGSYLNKEGLERNAHSIYSNNKDISLGAWLWKNII